MKKLNRKGFTLVELLAVIIILAIVVGITIPAITNVINDSKNNSLGVAVDAAEKFFTEQYSLMQVDINSANSNFTTEFQSVALPVTGWTTAKTISGELLKVAGFETVNVTTVTVKYNNAGAACVEVTKIPTSSKYYTTEHWKTDGTANGAQNKSKSC